MAIPETYDLVLPLLEIIKDKDEYKVQEVTEEVIDYIDISDEDKEITLPNNEPVINSRISTANTYLKKAELIESNRFMYFNITEEGLRLLDENPDKITEEDLMEYDGFREYKKVFIHDDTKDLDINELNPTDALRESFKKQMESVQKEIEDDMKKIKKMMMRNTQNVIIKSINMAKVKENVTTSMTRTNADVISMAMANANATVKKWFSILNSHLQRNY